MDRELEAQMLAQEVQRLMVQHPEMVVRHVLHVLHERTSAFLREGFEVGVVLDSETGPWFADVISCAARVPEQELAEAAPPGDDEMSSAQPYQIAQ